MSDPVAGKPGDAAFDGERMRDLAAWTALSLATKDPNPFGCEIVHSATGERLMRGLNAVSAENDPSSHAEVRTMRLACAKLKSPSLKGYTLYTTCEPCPMCMSDALWAGVDRVVRRDHRGRQPLHAADSNSGNGGCAAFRHEDGRCGARGAGGVRGDL